MFLCSVNVDGTKTRQSQGNTDVIICEGGRGRERERGREGATANEEEKHICALCTVHIDQMVMNTNIIFKAKSIFCS